jgi:chromosome partitioning protein
MKFVALQVPKGGVGKTTTAVNLSWALARDRKVLIVDLDPQGNTTGWLVTDPMHSDLADVLSGKATLADTIKQVRENLYVLPTFAVNGELKNWSETELPRKPLSFRKLRDALETFEFDLVVFDMSPGLSMLERSALAVVDEIIPVMKAENFSFDGLQVFESEISKMRDDLGLHAEVSKLVMNQVNQAFKVHREYLSRFGESYKYQFFIVSQSVKLPECVEYHQTIQEYKPKDTTVDQYQELADAVLSRQKSLLAAVE